MICTAPAAACRRAVRLLPPEEYCLYHYVRPRLRSVERDLLAGNALSKPASLMVDLRWLIVGNDRTLPDHRAFELAQLAGRIEKLADALPEAQGLFSSFSNREMIRADAALIRSALELMLL